MAITPTPPQQSACPGKHFEEGTHLNIFNGMPIVLCNQDILLVLQTYLLIIPATLTGWNVLCVFLPFDHSSCFHRIEYRFALMMPRRWIVVHGHVTALVWIEITPHCRICFRRRGTDSVWSNKSETSLSLFTFRCRHVDTHFGRAY